MKKLIAILLILSTVKIIAQSPCEFSVNVADSTGTYKSTNDFLVYERNFGSSETYILMSLINSDSTPLLNIKTIQKSTEFIKANCMDASTKVIFQLLDGKIISLIHNNEQSCGAYAQNPDDKKNVRFNSGLFLFLKGTMEDLKKSPISLMRLQYSTGKIDYVMQRELKSEFTKNTEYPEKFFINNLHCIE